MRLSLFANRYLRDREEEVLNALTHSFGLGLAASMTVALYVKAVPLGSWHTVCALVYGLAHVLVYLSSVAYHLTSWPPLKTRLRIVDQSAIFLAITGTYTPVLALGLSGVLGYIFTVLLWAACLYGIFYKVRHRAQPEQGSLISYLLFAAAGGLLFFLCGSGPIHESRTIFLVSGAFDLVGLVYTSTQCGLTS
ncbi:MAG: hypothetical protein EBZ49_07540 [Proteobacteria bacterium]|nr:hypothetical protein [Pseudomonadota bacterium]